MAISVNVTKGIKARIVLGLPRGCDKPISERTVLRAVGSLARIDGFEEAFLTQQAILDRQRELVNERRQKMH